VTSSIRRNEGEAANYGIYFDDTEYDYMQHMRDICASSEAVFVEAPLATPKQRNRSRQEVVLRDTLAPENLLPKELLPSEVLVKRTYQDQQDIPDALAGFQPDMDPRLREVLEALEDEEYVDDDEEIFGELTKGAEEVDENEFHEQGEQLDFYCDEGDDDGWATDTTEKPIKQQTTTKKPMPEPANNSKSVSFPDDISPPPDANSDWMSEYSKFRRSQTPAKYKAPDSEISSSLGDLSVGGLSSIYSTGGSRSRRRRKRAAAGSVYSMTSSVLQRTEGQSLLDDRFAKIEALYESDEGSDGNTDDTTPQSRPSVPQEFKESRLDFDAIMDDFLGSYSVVGKYGRRVRIGKQQSGLEQLDEIRRELGRATIPSR